MWTRQELKTRAKAGLKIYYWLGLVVCFISGLLGGNASKGISLNLGGGTSGLKSQLQDSFQYQDPSVILGILFILLAIFAVAFVIATVFGAFVSDPIGVGKNSFFIKSSKEKKAAAIDELISSFKSGYYLNVVKTLFLKKLFQFFWSLLLIIPGIVKSYEYYMIPYLMAEFPDMDSKEAFRLSKEMMRGEKFNTWVLELSFIGWYLLGVLACCIGTIFVNPYKEATLTELYLELKKKVFTPAAETVETAGTPETQNLYYDNH